MKLRKRVLAAALAVLIATGIMPQMPARAAGEAQADTVRNFANVVVFTHFKDDGQSDFYNKKARDTDEHNAGRQIQEYYDGSYGRSMKSYLNTVSYGKFQVHNIFPQMDENGSVTPYELPYSKEEAAGGNIDYNIITSVLEKAGIDLSGEVLDYDRDGAVDNLTVILLGEAPSTTPNGMPSLYPHQSFYPGTARLSGTAVRNYNILNTKRLIGNAGGEGSLIADESALIIHEFLHSLGYPDLYRMSYADEPVYTWDIMGQSMKYVSWPLAYMRQRFTSWITLPEHRESGKVEIEKANDAVIIRGPANPYEFFVVESRVKGNPVDPDSLDAGIGGTGVIVYRVDTTVSGLSNFSNKTAVYVFRPQEGQAGYTPDKERTNVTNAYLPYGKRNYIGKAEKDAGLADGALTYNDGTNSRIVISDIQVDAATGKASFDVSVPDAADFDLWQNTFFPSADRVYAVTMNGKQYALGVNGTDYSSTCSAQVYEYSENGTWKARGGSYSIGQEVGDIKLLVNGDRILLMCILNADKDGYGFKEALQAYEWNPQTDEWKKGGSYKVTGSENEISAFDAAVMNGAVYVNCISGNYGRVSLLKYTGSFQTVSDYINGSAWYKLPTAVADGNTLYLGVSGMSTKAVEVRSYREGGTLEAIAGSGSADSYSLELYNNTLYCALGTKESLKVSKYDSVNNTWGDYAQKDMDSFTIEIAVAQGNLYAITRPSKAGSDGKLAVYAIQETAGGVLPAVIEMEGSHVGIPDAVGRYGLIASNENLFAYYIGNGGGGVISRKATANRLLSLTIKAPDRVTYKKGDEVSAAGLEVTANYVKGTKVLDAGQYKVSGFDAETAGEKEATVSFGGVTNTFAYQVFDVVEEPPVTENIPKEVTLYPDADGNITMTEEQLKTVNSLDSSLCVTVMFKYTETPRQDKAYALFTLEGNAGEFYTVWHAPDRHKQDGTTDGCIGYSYEGSDAGGYWSNPNGRIKEQGKWLKASCYVSKATSDRQFFSALNGKTVANPTGDIKAYVADKIFTASYVSGHNGKSGNPVSLNTFGKPIDAGYEIRYVKISSKPVSSAEGLNSGVQEEVDPSVQTEYRSSRELCLSAEQEDYTVESWSAFEAAKADIAALAEGREDVPAGQEWTYCGYIDEMRSAISQLSVCFHNFKNGVCTVCRRPVQQEKKYTVTVYADGAQTDVREDVIQSTVLKVTAERTKGGRTFSHWSNTEQGTEKLCTDLGYNFYVTKDMKLYAIYTDGTAVQTPAITMSNTYAKLVDFKHRLYFEVTRHVPDGYTVKEQGVLYGVDGSVFENADNVTVDKDTGAVSGLGILKYKGSGTANRGVLTFTIPVDGHLNDTVYARGYMIVENEAKERAVYTTPIAEVTYNGLIGGN